LTNLIYSIISKENSTLFFTIIWTKVLAFVQKAIEFEKTAFFLLLKLLVRK
jgi:hypothetical protein